MGDAGLPFWHGDGLTLRSGRVYRPCPHVRWGRHSCCPSDKTGPTVDRQECCPTAWENRKKKRRNERAKRKSAAPPARAAAPLSRSASSIEELVRLVQERAELVIEAGSRRRCPANLLRASTSLNCWRPPAGDRCLQRCVRAILREVASGCRGLSASRASPSSARCTASAIWRPFIVSARASSSCPWAASRPCSRRSIASSRISGWCRSRTRPTAAWPTRWTCSPGCGCGFAARWSCGFTTRCWEMPADRSPRGLQQAAGAVAVPQLAGQAPAGGPDDRGHEHLDGRPVGGEKPGAAAIASLQAGVHYGLDVLAESIEDNPVEHHAVCGDRRPRRRRGPATTARPCCFRSSIAPAPWPTR